MPEWAWCQSNVAPCSMLWHRCAVAAALVVTRQRQQSKAKRHIAEQMQEKIQPYSHYGNCQSSSHRHSRWLRLSPRGAAAAAWPQPHAPPRSSPVVISSWWQDHQPPPSSSYQGPCNMHQLMGATPNAFIKQYNKLSDFKKWKLYENQSIWYAL